MQIARIIWGAYQRIVLIRCALEHREVRPSPAGTHVNQQRKLTVQNQNKDICIPPFFIRKATAKDISFEPAEEIFFLFLVLLLKSLFILKKPE